MRHKLLCVALVTLTGCGHTTLIRPCITPAQLAELEKQEPPKVADKLTGKADEDVRTLAGSSLRLRGWSYNLRDALRVCAK